MPQLTTIRLADFCRLFAVDDRQVRYILEEGHIPQGVERQPSTGNRREFGPGHAFWLAIVLKLKQTGLRTALAAEVADIANKVVRAAAQNFGWDPQFWPAGGYFVTKHRYFLDIGDLEFVQLTTDCYPSKVGLYECGWGPIKGRTTAPLKIRPFVNLRVDLARIAATLAQVEAWSHPCPG